MKTAKLIIDGKEIEIQINEEQLEQLCPQKKKTGYERAEFGKYYWRINDTGLPSNSITEGNGYYDTELYNSGNYYSDKTVAENNARADKLMRQLRRFAVEHREKKLDWVKNNYSPKFKIIFDHNEEDIRADDNKCIQLYGTIYFDTEEIAELAIDTFKDELLWYFTEYKDSL